MTQTISIRRYSEMLALPTYDERLKYLKLDNLVGEDTFGYDRYLNQQFYKSAEWLRIRNEVIIRDNGCDLGDQTRPIYGRIIIHHINPITKNDIINSSDALMNPEFLVCCSHDTHNMIHYGDISKAKPAEERSPNDTCPWRQ